MSLLTAGKQISVGTSDKAYGRGLFFIDQEEAERKARNKQRYQEQLRMQMEEDRRRKLEQKKKDDEYDKRLEQKIKEDIKKEGGPVQLQSKNDKNYQSPPPLQVKSQDFNSQQSRVQHREKRVEQPYNYKFNFHIQTQTPSNRNPYLSKNFSSIQAEEQRYFEENNTQRLRAMHEVLEEKLNEVYKRIKLSQDLEVDKEFEVIRKKILSSNKSYDTEKYHAEQLQGEVSHFYRIPKKHDGYETNSRAVSKNLNYDSNSTIKRTETLLKPVTQTRVDTSRNLVSRDSGVSNEDRLWGVKKGQNNFLGNRQAMDYQINSIMGKIDGLLEDKGY